MPATNTKTFTNGPAIPAGRVYPTDLNWMQDEYGKAAAAAGANLQGAVRSGKSIIDPEGTRSSSSFGALSNGPDEVPVELATDGLLFIAFQGIWKSTVADSGFAALFLNNDQLRIAYSTGAGAVRNSPQFQAVQTSGGAVDGYGPLTTYPLGLQTSSDMSSTSPYLGHITTGQIIGTVDIASEATGGIVAVFAAAGAYDVSVRFRATTGAVAAKERKLWVWTREFA